jgi:hypothetical protein
MVGLARVYEASDVESCDFRLFSGFLLACVTFWLTIYSHVLIWICMHNYTQLYIYLWCVTIHNLCHDLLSQFILNLFEKKFTAELSDLNIRFFFVWNTHHLCSWISIKVTNVWQMYFITLLNCFLAFADISQ